MQQAVDMALAHNPVLLSAQQNLLSMKGQEVEAGLRQNPDFSLYGTDLSQSGQLPPLLTVTVCKCRGSLSAGKSGAGAWIARGRRPRRRTPNIMIK